jgi:hypothetical protein
MDFGSKSLGMLLRGASFIFVCTFPNAVMAERHALLIGVDKVDKVHAIPLLAGVAHDIRLVSQLALKWGVLQTKLKILANTGDADSPPTYAEVSSAMERLNREARHGDEVLFYLSGHGVQQPASVQNQAAEADRYEEVFLLADSTPWTVERWSVGNALADSTLREWVEQMADKGVFVWLVVDTCYAAGMTRGEESSTLQTIGDWEVTARKSVLPQRLGIDFSRSPIKKKYNSTGIEPKASRIPGLRAKPQAIFHATSTHPNVLAFHAVSESDEALEVRIKGRHVGLFTHLLHETFVRAATLDGLATKVGIPGRSYKELADSVAGTYRRLPPSAPSPTFSGTLWTRPVFPIRSASIDK